MELSVKERLLLIGLLKQQSGNVVTLRVVTDTVSSLGFSETELERFQFEEHEPGSLRWKSDEDGDTEIAIGEAAKTVIKKALQAADRAEQLTLDHISLYEKFIEDKVPAEQSAA